MILKLLTCSLLVFYLTGCSPSFEPDGKNKTTQEFNCSNVWQETNLTKGQYVVRLNSECEGEDSISIGEQKYSLNNEDLIIEINEGEKVKVLCTGEDGKCTLLSVRIGEELAVDQQNYLPPKQMADECEETEKLIARSTIKGNVRVFYSPCKNGKVEIRVLDEADARVAIGGGRVPRIKDLWFSTPIDVENGYKIFLKCKPNENSEGNCKYTLGWK